MSWTSGIARYQVRESADEIVAGIREQVEGQGLALVAKPMRRGVRLCLATPGSLPAFAAGVVELRFETTEEGLTRVRLRVRRRRRWWVPPVLGLLGLFALTWDMFVTMGLASREFIRGAHQAADHHRHNDPELLHGVARFLGPRDLGRVDATPFRRQLPEAD